MVKYLFFISLFFIILGFIKCQDPIILPSPIYFYTDDQYPRENPSDSEFCKEQPNIAPTLGPDGLPQYCCGDNPVITSIRDENYTIFQNSADFYKYFAPIPCTNYLVVMNHSINATADIYGYHSIETLGYWELNQTLEEITSKPNTTSTMRMLSFYGTVGSDGKFPNVYIYTSSLTILYINGIAVPLTVCGDSYEEYNYTLPSDHQPGERVNISIFSFSRGGFSLDISIKDLENIDCDRDDDGVCLGRNQYNPPLPTITNCQEYALECGLTVVVDKNCTNDNPICEDVQCSIDKGGCFSTSKCGESNSCFIISCSNSTGCVSSEVICDDNDPCTLDSCNNSTGCVYTPIVCDTSNESSCLKNICSQGKCSLISNCTTSTMVSPTSTTTTSITSTTSITPKITTATTRTTIISSSLGTIPSSLRTISSSLGIISSTSGLPTSNPHQINNNYLCNYYSCPFNYTCIQLSKAYTCISNQFCKYCEPDKLKIFY